MPAIKVPPAPAVNSTSQEYIYPPGDAASQLTPCFSYVNVGSSFGVTKDGVYAVNSTALYKEPELWTKSGSRWTLNDYKFAYGNRMSDSDGNPFSIPSSGMASGVDGGSTS